MQTSLDYAATDPSEATAATLAVDARSAQVAWARSNSAAKRAALLAISDRLERHSREFADAITVAVSKPISESQAEVRRAVDIVRYYAAAVERIGSHQLPSALGTMSTIERRPHGVVGLITPWNFPLAIPVWKLIPAIAMGNSVILKASPLGQKVAELLISTISPELPPGLVALLRGDAAAGKALIEAADAISFTGSTAVGRHVVVASAARNIPVQAEMGGQNVALILPDADLLLAAQALAPAAAAFAGQKCTALRRVIVVGEPDRAGEFADLLGQAMSELQLGDPTDPATVVGPLVSDDAAARFDAAVDGIRRAGGSVATAVIAEPHPPRLRAPAVATNISIEHPAMHAEIFGPLCAVQPAASLHAAIRLANVTPYRLVCTVFGHDATALDSVTKEVDFGLIRRNLPTTGLDYNAPFGGAGMASYGPPEQGEAALVFFTRNVTITD